jgi:hypothetical protein
VLNPLVEHRVDSLTRLLFFGPFTLSAFGLLLPAHFRHLLPDCSKVHRLQVFRRLLPGELCVCSDAWWSSSQNVIQGCDSLLLSSDPTPPGQCSLLIARPGINSSQIDDCHAMVGLLLECFQQSLTGSIELALLHVRVPQIAQQIGVPAGSQGSQVVILGIFESPFLVPDATQHLQGVRILRINLQCRLELYSGIGKGVVLQREIASLQKRVQTRQSGGIEIRPRTRRTQIRIAILSICDTARRRVDITTAVAPWNDVAEAAVEQRQLTASQNQAQASRKAEGECAHLGNHPWLR